VIVDVEEGTEILRKGGVVAYPTETVYGLGADGTSHTAVERLLALKGRDRERGLSVLVSGGADLERWAVDCPPVARRLADRFWPGPLTIVVPAAAKELGDVATERGVGFRCSPQPTAAALAKRLGRPVVSTSCNPTGEKACLNAEEVERRFGAELPVVGGEPAGGLPPSTVVAVSIDGTLELLREGATPFGDVLTEAGS
jgi:L-threonylcarbamoyladenylate synthase